MLRKSRCPHLWLCVFVLSRSSRGGFQAKLKWANIKQERTIFCVISLYLENHEKMPLQLADKTFKRFPLLLNTSLWVYALCD